MYYIIKRDGVRQPFNPEKVKNAVTKAFQAVDGEITEYAQEKAKNIADYIQGYMDGVPNELTIDQIQSLVEHGLMSCKRKDVATAYIEYRHDRDKTRKWNNHMMNVIKEKLAAEDVQNQNANVDEYSFGGRKGEADSILMKELALDNYMSEKHKLNHINNRIYIHDLDSYAVGMHNCLTIPFDDLLAKGFDTRQTDIRPANSIGTAFQLVAVIFQLQSLQQFGGVSASHLDWTMVPYVRKSFWKHYKDAEKYLGSNYYKPLTDEEVINKSILDYYDTEENSAKFGYAFDMTEKELQQAVEGMYHNLNTLQSRSGNQLPFTSINYGTCTLLEGRMVIKALLEGSLKGVGKHHKTPIFPCGIFQMMKGVNRKEGDPNYDLYKLALKSTAKRLYPNYANCDWSGNAGYDKNDPRTYFSTMGCRTANGWDINGFGQLKDGRGNICPNTIILPTLAMEALFTDHKEYAYDKNGNKLMFWKNPSSIVEDFMKLLDEAIHDAKDELIERFEWICSQSPQAAKFMYGNNTMAGYIPEEGIKSALKHGTLAIGQLGLAECLEILIGKDQTTEEGMELAKQIEQLFKDRCAEFKEKYKLNFGVYYTPKNMWAA